MWLGTLSGCSLGYYVHSARGQAALMSRRVAIEQVISDPATSEELRTRLQRVQKARAFAIDELGLPAKKGYRSYADLERPYAVWSVTATTEFSLEPRTWCFPVAGCVSYRGYFDESAAIRFAEGLRRRGFEVSVRGVAAYSTLGYFDDPVLSSMLHWDDTQLIAIIFHELAHQLFYTKDDTPFNESFASVVEEAGMARWTTKHGAPGEMEKYRERSLSETRFAKLVGKTREQLSGLYASAATDEEKRQQKAELFKDLVRQYEALRDAGEISSGYDDWFARDLNNADLAAVGVYHQWVPALRALLAKSGNDLRAFYDEARRLGQLRADDRAKALSGLLQP